MTEKLSTAKLKKMIGEWLATPVARKNLEYHSEGDPLEEARIWKMWCDGGQWKRREKRALKDEWEDKFSTTDWENKPAGWQHGQPLPTIPYFDIDMMGEANMELVTKFHADPKQAAKCIFRCFEPDNDLADNYRLEIITTPDDSKVIGWTVIVD